MRLCIFSLLLAVAVMNAGCGSPSSASTTPTSPGTSSPEINTAKYVLATEPDGGMGVITAREEAKHDQEVVLVGRIGGRENPWIDGRAAFMMIDASMQIVESGEECEGNAVCTDDCCAGKLAACTTLVKVVDENGRPLPIDARELLSAKEMDMVVVKGKIQRDDKEQVFVVLADGVYVRR